MRHTLIAMTILLVTASCVGSERRIASLQGVTSSPVDGAITGLLPAKIIEIDGTAIETDRLGHSVSPGTHTVKVWPIEFGAPSSDMRRDNALELDFEATAGSRYRFAAETRRYRTAAYGPEGGLITESPWTTIVVPVIVYADDRSQDDRT